MKAKHQFPNELQTQIEQYHQNDSMKISEHLSANSCLVPMYCKSKLDNLNMNLTKIKSNSVSILTPLKAPLASIDCCELTETPSLVDINNHQMFNKQLESLEIDSLASFTKTLTPSSSLLNHKPNPLGIDDILEKCPIHEKFAISALNRKCCSSECIHEERSFIEMNKNFRNRKIETIRHSHYFNECSLKSSRFIKVLNQKRKALRRFVDGKFQWIIICAILVNTFSMSIEHHNQVNKRQDKLNNAIKINCN